MPRKKHISLVSLFSGLGAYERALQNLKIEYELLNYCELDRLTARSYSILHDVDESRNLVNVRAIDPEGLPQMDLLVYSPPCQDISTIGTHAGISENTRTGLMWPVVDIIRAKRPRAFVMENVRNLAGKYRAVLDDYMRNLQAIGYKCSYEILNAKDYCTPQNRNRLFLVGIREDMKQGFKMPEKQPLQRYLKDYLPFPVKSIDRDLARTVRVGGRGAKPGDRRNWDGYRVNGAYYRLTSRDCLILMGYTDEDYDKLRLAGISEGRIAKVAGNSIVVGVLESILANLLPCIEVYDDKILRETG